MENSSKRPSFIPASGFQGRREGYVFKKDNEGLGYYLDRVNRYLGQQARPPSSKIELPSNDGTDMSRKRKVPDSFYDDDDNEPPASRNSSDTAAAIDDEPEIARTPAEPLDESRLKQLLLSFEKKITKNQKQRMKHPDEPEKFMESEFELHKEIEELHAIAASPELYPIVVQMNSLKSILSMITHENTDISLAAVSLLQELTDVDTINETPTHTMGVVDGIAAEPPGLELLVQNLFRLDETQEEDAQGVYNTLSVLENLLDIDGDRYASIICERTPILRFLLTKLRNKAFDDNKLYASEVLSMLLQMSSQNCRRLVKLRDVGVDDGMEALLQCLAVYRRKEVERQDEQECVENLFLCLHAVLVAEREHQQRFLELEGYELLLRCLEAQEYASGCTVKALSYAVVQHRAGCQRLVDVGGLKFIFAMLVGKGLKKSLRKKGSGEKRHVEESAFAIIAQLCCQLFTTSAGGDDYRLRIVGKFVENDNEKLLACVEHFVKYQQVLRKTDADLERTRQLLEQQGDDEALEDFLDEDNLLVQRLDGGLFPLQQLTLMMVFAVVSKASCAEVLLRTLSQRGVESEFILDVLRDMILTLREAVTTGDDDNEDSESSTAGKELTAQEIESKQQLELLTSWSAGFSQRLGQRR